ncbi:hypothetical protein VTK73DRAFT_3153 [Phialemonium thermophilum]|uniref:Uncharacterized protein n=1 Tax=Phialemonium thermophilum TaxID=223376 RepID=A0ABR3VN15_9PEZI
MERVPRGSTVVHRELDYRAKQRRRGLARRSPRVIATQVARRWCPGQKGTWTPNAHLSALRGGPAPKINAADRSGLQRIGLGLRCQTPLSCWVLTCCRVVLWCYRADEACFQGAYRPRIHRPPRRAAQRLRNPGEGGLERPLRWRFRVPTSRQQIRNPKEPASGASRW